MSEVRSQTLRRSALGLVIRGVAFAIVAFVLVTWLWIDVNLDCLNDDNYSGCPRHLPGPLRVFFPYGFVMVVWLGAMSARSRITTTALMVASCAVVLVVLGGLEWWLTGDVLPRYL